MTRKINLQVGPKVTAAVILAVLILIQVVWWRGLVAKPGPGHGGGRVGGARPASLLSPVILTGRQAVRVDTLAGEPEPGAGDGPGRNARFDGPIQLAIDPQGTLTIADSRNHRIRQITPTGKTLTLAGSLQGYADGAAAMARFSLPCGVAVGPDGSVYVADTGNQRIRRIRNGQVTTLANGQSAATRFDLPVAIAFGRGGQEGEGVTLADAAHRQVRILDLSGKLIGGWETTGTPIGLLTGKQAAVVASGILVPDGPRWKRLNEIPIDLQGKSTNQTDFTLRHPVALCPAPGGWFVTDSEWAALFYVHDGKADLVAGHCQARTPPVAWRFGNGWRDGNGDKVEFGVLGGIVTDGHGHLYVCDVSNNAIRRVTLPSDLAGNAGVRR